MARVVTDDKHYKAIMDAVRTGPAMSGETCQPKDMAGAVANAMNGMYSIGYDDGFAVGEQSEHDCFWDMIQQNGQRTAYEYAFMDWGWECARPKHKVVPTAGQPIYVFTYCKYLKYVEAAYFDFSSLSQDSERNTDYMYGYTCTFMGCTVLERVEDIGLKDRYYYRTFRNCKGLVTIDKIAPSSASMFYQPFYKCNELVNLTVAGTIGQDGFDLQYSTKLSKDSITSVITALSASASGKSVTFSKTAADNAFTEAEWAELVATKTNWTVNLV